MVLSAQLALVGEGGGTSGYSHKLEDVLELAVNKEFLFLCQGKVMTFPGFCATMK